MQTVTKDLATLPGLSVAELKERYTALFGDMPRTTNKAWLQKRVAWRLQSLAEGDLSERARRRAMELANDADVRTTAPRERPTIPLPAKVETKRDDRLPAPGTIITKKYKGTELAVQVLSSGFAFNGELYLTLSAIAKMVSGSHCNGFLFFGLTKRKGVEA